MKYCFGVDIGGTTVKLGLFTTEGEIVDKWEIKTRTENQGEAVLPDIAAALNERCGWVQERAAKILLWSHLEPESAVELLLMVNHW